MKDSDNNPLNALIEESLAKRSSWPRGMPHIPMTMAYIIIHDWYTRHRDLCDYLQKEEYAAYARKLIDLMPVNPSESDMRYIFSEVSNFGLEWAFPILAGQWPLGYIARGALQTAGYSTSMTAEELEESSVWKAMRASPEWEALRGK